MNMMNVGVAIVLFCAFLGHGLAGPSNLQDVDTYLKVLADNQLWGGMAHVTQGGKQTFSRGYGQAVPELGVKMRGDHRFAIGSNSKLFIAVAVWQLHAQGKININDPVTKYMDYKDFGLNSTWCPRLVNVTTGPCQVPKIYQLLSMQSGLLDTDNCVYPHPDVWQTQYCWSGSKGVTMPFSQTQPMSVGAAGLITVMNYYQIFQMPLQHLPGTTYAYINANFLIAGYIVERVTGLTTRQYYQKYIFDRVGMKDTLYDFSQGNDGVYKGLLSLPGYVAYLSPLSLGVSALDYDVIGDDTLKVGDLGNMTRNPETAPYGTAVKLARIWGAFNGFPYNYGLTAGAIVSTHWDMAKWFRVLSRKPEVLGLNNTLLKQMFTTGIKISTLPSGVELHFCQGVLTSPNKNLTLGTNFLFYNGNLGYDAIQYTQLHPTDPAQDIHVGTLAYQIPYSNYFNFRWQQNNVTTTPNANPMSPSTGKQTCQMSVAENPDWYKPFYGAYGGMVTRSKKAFDTFLAAAKKANNPAATGWVPAPQFYCDAGSTSMGIYFGSVVTAGALNGTAWFSP